MNYIDLTSESFSGGGANTDLNNLTPTGKKNISTLVKPSGQTESITIPESGTEMTFTASVNGRVWVGGAGDQTGWIYLQNKTGGGAMQNTFYNLFGFNLMIDCSEGDEIYIVYPFTKPSFVYIIKDKGVI